MCIESAAVNLLEALRYGNCVLANDIEVKFRLLLANINFVEDYRNRAREYARAIPDWNKITDQFEEMYFSLAA